MTLNLSLPFTQTGYQALGHAERLADGLSHARVTPEHVLVALAQVPDGHARLILEALKVDLSRLRETLIAALQRQPADRPLRADPFITPAYSADLESVLREAEAIAQRSGFAAIDTRHILLGLFRAPDLPSTQVLQANNVTAPAVQARGELTVEALVAKPQPAEPRLAAGPAPGLRLQISPVFLLLVAVTAIAGVLAYTELLMPGPAAFLFVTGGWIVSVCLHEFGHALVAYWGGDTSVADKGYLSLNPFKYTHPVLSILLPVLFMIVGGIGLPGGAVYINRGAIPSRWKQSLASAAGPLATAIVAVVAALPFWLGWSTWESHIVFWAGLALLAFLQVTSLFLNLLPIPGLDGFGSLAPFLPEGVLRIAYSFGPFTFLLVYAIFFFDNPIRDGFWSLISAAIGWVRLDPLLIGLGFDLFRFWQTF
jgi:Zn-dependent protease